MKTTVTAEARHEFLQPFRCQTFPCRSRGRQGNVRQGNGAADFCQNMKTTPNLGQLLAIALPLVLAVTRASAATRYVWQDSPSPAPPYTSWATAATNIQLAVDAAAPGDQVLVTNGLYAAGGRAVYGTMTNRVAVDRHITVASVNGREVTIIQGYQEPGTTNGNSAIRCVYLTNGASLSGFTLTNGATRADGDWQLEQSGGGAWCASINAVLMNCLLTGNSAYSGGGGVYQGTANNCTLTGNWAGDGGGAYDSTLNNCTLTDNPAYYGGATAGGTLNNCTLTGNSAYYGGGAGGGTLNNCTLTGNSANEGGGAYQCILNDCIVYFNQANHFANYNSGSVLNYCCSTPLPSEGIGNISVNPQLASATHLSAASSCRGAGSAAYATGTDIDGEAWASPPSIGCDEYHAGAMTGPLSVGIVATSTNVATGYPAGLTALIEGWTAASVWDFGDGLVASNQPYSSHAWASAGNYAVALRAYNQSNPLGVSATTVVHVVTQPVHHVAANNANPVAPYTSWVTAATNIQDAVDAATVTGALVLVTNGVYATGGRTVVDTTTNRVAIDRLITVQSVNGPGVTIIRGWQVPGTKNGDGAIRCSYLAAGASLVGFTLTNGATRAAYPDFYGGGVECESSTAVVSNCVIVGNSAGYGGGASGGTLIDCMLTGNSAERGGGAFGGALNNCTLTGNSAARGGGTAGSILNNCTLTGNAAAHNGGGAYEGTLSNCTLTSNEASYGGGAGFSTLNNCTLDLNSASEGGGADGSLLNNCTLTSNSAQPFGGGAYRTELNNCNLIANVAQEGGGAAGGTLNNCNLTGNSANSAGGAWGATLNNCTLTSNLATQYRGGAYGCTLNNCIIYLNSAPIEENYSGGVFNYCCTMPLPTNGVGNITNEPLFVDAGGGDFRLQPNSPCINAGKNAYAPGLTDLDGNPRIVGGTVDIGAYEFQSPNSVLSYAWAQQHGLPTDGSTDFTDADADGHNNWQEWKAWTDPTNALSVLKLLTPQPGTNATLVTWQSVNGQKYFLERATNVAAPFSLLQSNLVGQAGTTSVTDTNAADGNVFFYRVAVP